jgi:hypothetical protein
MTISNLLASRNHVIDVKSPKGVNRTTVIIIANTLVRVQ